MTKEQSDQQADNMSFFPAVVPLLTIRFLFWDVGCQGVHQGCRGCQGYIGGWQGVGAQEQQGYRWHWGILGGVGVSGGPSGVSEVHWS